MEYVTKTEKQLWKIISVLERKVAERGEALAKAYSIIDGDAHSRQFICDALNPK